MNNSRNFWTSILVLVVGIILIFMQGRSLDAIVTILGVLFVAAAVLNFVLLFGQKNRQTSTSVISIIGSVASAALGVWMLVDPAGLTSLIVYVFAGLMILGGLYHIVLLAWGMRPFRAPFGFYILPALLIITGTVIMVLGATATKNFIVLVTGIAMVVYAVSAFIESAGHSAYNRTLRDSAPRQVEDVTPTEVNSDNQSVN